MRPLLIHTLSTQFAQDVHRQHAATAQTPTFARVFAARWSRVGAEQDGPPGEETPDGPDVKPTRLNRMEENV